MEAISNIRTVAQLTREKHFGDEYCKSLDIPLRSSLKRAHVFGLIFSFTDSVRIEHTSSTIQSIDFLQIMFFALAALFTFGAWRVEQNAMK